MIWHMRSITDYKGVAINTDINWHIIACTCITTTYCTLWMDLVGIWYMLEAELIYMYIICHWLTKF